MTCKQCGEELKDEARFCTNCGATIEDNAKVGETEATKPPETQDAKQQNDAQTTSGFAPTIKKAMSLYDKFFWVFFVLTGLAALTFIDLSGSYLDAGRAMTVIFIIVALLTVFAHIACSVSRLIVNSKKWKDDGKSQVFDLICFGVSALITLKVVLTAISLLVKLV